MHMAMILGPLFALMVVGVIAVHFLQTGFMLTSQPLSPDLSRLSPLQGLKRIFSITTLYETAKGIFKVIVLGAILYFALTREAATIPMMVDMSVNTIVDFSFDQVRKLVLYAGIVLTIFAATDFAFQRWQFGRSLRMTKQEIREEYKEVEGSPLIKARIKSLQREMARRRMMQEIPGADVVITNPTHFAVALKYDPQKMGAPKVVAKGANLIAQRIRELAREHHVPTVEDKPLAQALFKQMEVGQEIPDLFYKAVAAILAQVYRMKGRAA
jgi:flagellar biosynthetic protein FlhB